MSRMPVLSICIATYNRARFLPETLDSVITGLPENVEVVIVDGASTDETPEVVREYQQRCERLRYFRQERNGGVDRDYDLAVQLAEGEYCFLFTDDDLLAPGAVQTILDVLTERYSLVVVNAEVRTADMSTLVQPRRCRMVADRVYQPSEAEALFADTADYLSFIGGVVIRRDLWLARQREPYFGTVFIHVGVIFQQPLPAPALYLQQPLAAIRYGNAMWTARGFEIWMFKWPELIWSFRFPDEAKRRVTAREPWRNVANLARFRAIGGFGPAEHERWIRARSASRLLTAASWCISRTPPTLLNALISVVARVLRGPVSTTSIDLQTSRFFWRRAFRQNRRPT
ncbi:MAG TPA: glycosyltransferase family 2 protein [Thermoanaerobaculia bacterium]|jgi:hypothetical protein